MGQDILRRPKALWGYVLPLFLILILIFFAEVAVFFLKSLIVMPK